jgi:Type VI secretion system effector, Hcp
MFVAMNSLTFLFGALLALSLAVEGLNITITSSDFLCTTPSGKDRFSANDWSLDTLKASNTGKAVFNNLLVTKETDGCSAALFTSMSTSRRHRVVTLSQYDDSKTEVIKVEISNAFVTSWNSSSSTKEKVAFVYGKIQFEAFGSRSCFDIIQSKQC